MLINKRSLTIIFINSQISCSCIRHINCSTATGRHSCSLSHFADTAGIKAVKNIISF